MGPEQGMAFVEAHPQLEAVLLTRTGEVLVSRDLAPTLVWPSDKPPAPPGTPAPPPPAQPPP